MVDVEDVASRLWREALEHEQAVGEVPNDAEAAAVRAGVRSLAKEARVKVRTARMGDRVAVVRLDAAIWNDDTATMRAKLGDSAT